MKKGIVIIRLVTVNDIQFVIKKIIRRVGFLSKLSSSARNALLHKGMDTLQKLSNYTEKEILKIHGIGPASLPVMRASLEEKGLSFKDNF